jgi:group I intron endonuclease
MIGIYKITNPVGQIYIGQSIDIKKRWCQYKSNLGKNQRMLNYSFRKYGYNNHIFVILEECKREVLNSREYYLISLYKGKLSLNCRAGCKIDSVKDTPTIKDTPKLNSWVERIRASKKRKADILFRKMKKIEENKIKKRSPENYWRW